jgi:hypothetical protein
MIRFIFETMVLNYLDHKNSFAKEYLIYLDDKGIFSGTDVQICT